MVSSLTNPFQDENLSAKAIQSDMYIIIFPAADKAISFLPQEYPTLNLVINFTYNAEFTLNILEFDWMKDFVYDQLPSPVECQTPV